MGVASNARSASAFFLSALIADALTARENVQGADAPASLRGTGLVLTTCLAAPLIVSKENGIYGIAQRPLLSFMLFLAALGGAHQGGVLTRAADAVFITIAGTAAVFLFSAGGVDKQGKAHQKGLEAAVARSSITMAGALMLFSNLRILRAGLFHATETINFNVLPPIGTNATGFSTLGYAYADDVSTSVSCFGSTIGIGASVVIFLHKSQLDFGTGDITFQMAVAGMYQAASALVSGLTFADQVKFLPALYSSSACKHSGEICSVAAASRRFAITNTPTAGLWLSSLGLFALAFAPSARVKTQSEANLLTWTRAAVLAGFGAVGASLVCVWFFATFLGVSWQSDYVMLLSIFAISVSAFVNTTSGSLIYIFAFLWEFWQYVEEFSLAVVYSHLTNVTLSINTCLLLLHVLISFLMFFNSTHLLELFAGGLATLGASLSTGLFLGSAHLYSSSNGSVEEFRSEGEGARAAINFTWQHFIPVFIWMPIFACRCETQLLSNQQRVAVWLSALPLLLVIYAGILFFQGLSAPAAALVEPWSAVAAAPAGLVLPWMLAGGV